MNPDSGQRLSNPQLNMKNLLTFLFTVLAFGASAQTNMITFTNKAGEKVSGTVTLVQPDGIVYRKDGGGGKVKFADLPAETQKQFGYDPAKAAAFSEKVSSAKENNLKSFSQGTAQLMASNAAKADLKKRADKFYGKRMEIRGSVSHKYSTGVTIECGKEFVDLRDVDPSLYHNHQEVVLYGYDTKTITITNLLGFPIQRDTVSLKIPDEFKSDPRAKEYP